MNHNKNTNSHTYNYMTGNKWYQWRMDAAYSTRYQTTVNDMHLGTPLVACPIQKSCCINDMLSKCTVIGLPPG